MFFLFVFVICSLGGVFVYSGKVKKLLSGKDGQPGSIYKVFYQGEGNFDIDHLVEDYWDDCVQFL
jgi:hypothetical protein